MDGKIKKFDLFCEKLVIGSELNALVYAHNNNCSLIFSKLNPPHFFEYSNFFRGRKIEIWDSLCFLLSLSGQLPLADKVDSIRVDNKLVSVSTKNNRSIKIGFDKLIVFDEEGVSGLNTPIDINDDKKMVLDWADVRSGMVHNFNVIRNTGDFINIIYFYPSDRVFGNHDKKDLVAVSYLTEGQLKEVKCSEIYAKFYIQNLMKKSGITGSSAGKNKNYSLKIDMRSREIRNVKRPYFEQDGCIEYRIGEKEKKINKNNINPYLLRVEKFLQK